ELTEIGRHCTDREKNAESAERDLRKFLILQLLSNKMGEVFPGVVTSVIARGLFVQIDKFVVDGFVKTTDLIAGASGGQPPRWELDKKTGALVDASSGRSYNVGHMVNVSIAHVDLLKRQLELAIAEGSDRSAGKNKTPKLTLGDGGGLGASEGA